MSGEFRDLKFDRLKTRNRLGTEKDAKLINCLKNVVINLIALQASYIILLCNTKLSVQHLIRHGHFISTPQPNKTSLTTKLRTTFSLCF